MAHKKESFNLVLGVKCINLNFLVRSEAEEAVNVWGAQRLVNNWSDYFQYSLSGM